MTKPEDHENDAPEWAPPTARPAVKDGSGSLDAASTGDAASAAGTASRSSDAEAVGSARPSLREATSSSWNDSFGDGEHPVRARLLEKARGAGKTERAPSLPASEDPTGYQSPRLDDDDGSSARLMASPPLSESKTEEQSVASEGTPAAPSSTVATPQAAEEAEAALADEAPLPPHQPLPARPRSHSSALDLASQAASFRTPLPPAADVAQEFDKIVDENRILPPGAGLSPFAKRALFTALGLVVIFGVGELVQKGDLHFAERSSREEKKKEAPPDKPPAPPKKEEVRKKIEGPWRINPLKKKAGQSVIAGKIGRAPFLKAIQDAGLSKSEAYRAYTSLKDVKNLDRCRPRDEFVALVEGPDKKLVAFEYIVSREEIFQATTGDDGLLHGKQLDLAVERQQIRRSFVHNGESFDDSAAKFGFDPGLSLVAQKALRGHMLMGEFRRGDRVRVIAQEVTVLGEFSRYAGIEAMEVARKGKDDNIRIYYFNHATNGGYYDRNGKAPYDGGWRKPIPDAPVTSHFNMKRMHPVLKRVHPHTGTDFGAPMGTPIHSTAPGVITFIGNGGPSGNLVKIKHEGGYESGYAHLSRFEKGLKVGDKVDRMQVVGYCGSTGRSTGPHLHFTMKKNGQYIDSLSLNLDGLRVLPKEYRADFNAVRAKYDPILDQIPWASSPEPEPAVTEEEESSEAAEMMLDDDSDAEASESQQEEAPSAPSSPALTAASDDRKKEPAKRSDASAIFLSNQELLKMQSPTDDGEVNP